MGKACGKLGWHSTTGQGTRHSCHNAPPPGVLPGAPLHLLAGTGHVYGSALSVLGATGFPRAPRGPMPEPRAPGGCCLLKLLWADESAANLRGSAQRAAARRGSRAGGTDRLLSVKERRVFHSSAHSLPRWSQGGCCRPLSSSRSLLCSAPAALGQQPQLCPVSYFRPTELMPCFLGAACSWSMPHASLCTTARMGFPQHLPQPSPRAADPQG